MSSTAQIMKNLTMLRDEAEFYSKLYYSMPMKDRDNFAWVDNKLRSTWVEINALVTKLRLLDEKRIQSLLKKNKYYKCPEKFLKAGQRVKAVVSITEKRGSADHVAYHAQPGEFGTVVHVEKGFWPTVKFERTGTMTCVTPLEVELLEE